MRIRSYLALETNVIEKLTGTLLALPNELHFILETDEVVPYKNSKTRESNELERGKSRGTQACEGQSDEHLFATYDETRRSVSTLCPELNGERMYSRFSCVLGWRRC